MAKRELELKVVVRVEYPDGINDAEIKKITNALETGVHMALEDEDVHDFELDEVAEVDYKVHTELLKVELVGQPERFKRVDDDAVEIDGTSYARLDECQHCGTTYAPRLSFAEHSDRFCSVECQEQGGDDEEDDDEQEPASKASE